MPGLWLTIVTIALFSLADSSRLMNERHQEAPLEKLSGVPAMQKKQVSHGTALVLSTMFSQLPKLAVTHIASGSFRQSDVPEFKHKKKPGGGYVKGSPLYEKQQGHRATEMILPGPPTGRQRPSVAVIMVCIVLGIFVLVIAAYINKDFLVRRHLDVGKLPDVPAYAPPTSGKFQNEYMDPTLQPVRAPVEYVESIPKSTRLDTTLPPTYQQTTVPPQPRYGEPPVSMMPSQQQQYPPMQQLGPPSGVPVSMSAKSPGPPSFRSLGEQRPPNPASPTQQGFMQQQQTSPSGVIYGSMPPQQTGGSGYLALPKSQQYASMPPVGSN